MAPRTSLFLLVLLMAAAGCAMAEEEAAPAEVATSMDDSWTTTVAPLDDSTAPAVEEDVIATATPTSTITPPRRGTSLTPFNETLAAKNYTRDELVKMVRDTQVAVAAAKAALAEALRDVDAAWTRYTTRFNLPDLRADQERKAVFRANLMAWQRLNQEKNDDMLAYGITQFAHLTKAEFEDRYLMSPSALRTVIGRTARQSARGLLQGSTPCNTAKAAPAWPSGLPLPTSWDWSACGAITPVKSQGGCGSCSAFATVGALESTWIRKWWDLGYRRFNTDLAEDDWLECTAGNQCKGAWPDSIFDRYICKGAPFEAAQPYNANDGNSCKNNIPRYNTGATGFAYVNKGLTPLARAVRRNPTVIAVYSSNWQGLAAGWVRNCGEPRGPAAPYVNHAVLVTGWVGNVPMSNGQNWDYWLIKNSWGAGFNTNGYIWVRKDCAPGTGPYGMYTYKPWTPIM